MLKPKVSSSSVVMHHKMYLQHPWRSYHWCWPESVSQSLAAMVDPPYLHKSTENGQQSGESEMAGRGEEQPQEGGGTGGSNCSYILNPGKIAGRYVMDGAVVSLENVPGEHPLPLRRLPWLSWLLQSSNHFGTTVPLGAGQLNIGL